LKDVPDARVRLVEALRIDAVERAHALGEITLGLVFPPRTVGCTQETTGK
jgi:hypothetical protein